MKLFDRKVLFDLIVTELERRGEVVTAGRRYALRQLFARDSIHVFARVTQLAQFRDAARKR